MGFSHSLFPRIQQATGRHLGLAKGRHEVELLNSATKVSAVTEHQRRRRKKKWIGGPIYVANKKLPFLRIECQPVDWWELPRGRNWFLLGSRRSRTQEPTFCDVAPAETTGAPAFWIQKHMIQALTHPLSFWTFVKNLVAKRWWPLSSSSHHTKRAGLQPCTSQVLIWSKGFTRSFSDPLV